MDHAVSLVQAYLQLNGYFTSAARRGGAGRRGEQGVEVVPALGEQRAERGRPHHEVPRIDRGDLGGEGEALPGRRQSVSFFISSLTWW